MRLDFTRAIGDVGRAGENEIRTLVVSAGAEFSGPCFSERTDVVMAGLASSAHFFRSVPRTVPFVAGCQTTHGREQSIWGPGK
ncbi:uncharacterized protein ColSpa_11428 [Colletotrichum spaethianum]|uniref:Uncharacterized protein n=1 Tax=Colletotrichum spaethianum TaxID=700344 RepID=A0AA37PFG2_9PEZI|nr:uncharacterized protein ColSpa_11428 [Colletotrichum spaethianum]GKT51247.1 hypothetical protein ColSpa_11428 [Colletotrichum spaethianum]